MRVRASALALAAAIPLVAGLTNPAIAQEAPTGDPGDKAVGKMTCTPEGSWRWWVLVFSRAYSECNFTRQSDGVTETYRGRSGIKFGGDFRRRDGPFEFNVFRREAQPEGELKPYEIAGEYTAGKATPKEDKDLELKGDKFVLRPVATARAVGWVYLNLELKREDASDEG